MSVSGTNLIDYPAAKEVGINMVCFWYTFVSLEPMHILRDRGREIRMSYSEDVTRRTGSRENLIKPKIRNRCIHKTFTGEPRLPNMRYYYNYFYEDDIFPFCRYNFWIFLCVGTMFVASISCVWSLSVINCVNISVPSTSSLPPAGSQLRTGLAPLPRCGRRGKQLGTWMGPTTWLP